MTIDSDFFVQINNAVFDLQASDLQSFERPLKALARLLRHSDLEEANKALTEGLDLDSFLAESNRSQGSMVGSAKLAWPDEPEKIMGLTLLLIEKFAGEPDTLPHFGFTFYHSGTKIIANVHAVVKQVIVPFVRDYKAFVLKRRAIVGVAATGVAGKIRGSATPTAGTAVSGTVSTVATAFHGVAGIGVAGHLDVRDSPADASIAAQDGTVVARDEEPISPPERESSSPRIAELRTLLDQTEQELRTVLPVVRAAWRAGMGHNHPPSPIDAPPVEAEEIEIGIDAVNVYRAELSNPASSPEIVEFCKRTLAQLRHRLEAFSQWLDQQRDDVLEKIRRDAGVLLVEGAMRGAGTAIFLGAIKAIAGLLSPH